MQRRGPAPGPGSAPQRPRCSPPGAATHGFVLLAEDGHGHRGEERQARGLRRGQLSGRKGQETGGSASKARGPPVSGIRCSVRWGRAGRGGDHGQADAPRPSLRAPPRGPTLARATALVALEGEGQWPSVTGRRRCTGPRGPAGPGGVEATRTDPQSLPRLAGQSRRSQAPAWPQARPPHHTGPVPPRPVPHLPVRTAPPNGACRCVRQV